MNMMISLTSQQLRQAADLKEKIDALQEQLEEVLGGEGPSFVPVLETVLTESLEVPKDTVRKRRKMSPQARANIRAAQQARRATERGETPIQTALLDEDTAPKAKKNFSPAARKALSLAAKKRWAKAKAAGKSSL
jgi:hypothetical protein